MIRRIWSALRLGFVAWFIVGLVGAFFVRILWDILHAVLR